MFAAISVLNSKTSVPSTNLKTLLPAEQETVCN